MRKLRIYGLLGSGAVTAVAAFRSAPLTATVARPR